MNYLPPVLAALALLVSRGQGSPTADDLFNGRDFSGWEFVSEPAVAIATVCRLLPDGVIAVTGAPVGYLATTTSYQHYRLHAEWRWTDKPGNSGVLVHISSGPKDRAWPLCLQIQMKNKSVGDLLPMAGASFAEPLAPNQKVPQYLHTAPDSEKPVGEWNTCDITSRGDTLEVTINGVAQNRITQASPHTGRIGFQFEGTPFELRNLSLQRLD